MTDIREIHQFHSGSAYGDAITNGMFFIQNLLRELGFRSEIYVQHIDERLRGKVKHYSEYKSSSENILFIHHSLGHDLDDWLLSLKENLILVYHNITPEKFFPKDSSLYRYSIKGRQQLKLLKEICKAAIADSELNRQELISFGFSKDRVFTIPLLFDIKRLKEHPFNKKLFDEVVKFFNVLFVGRIVENKKQDQLIDVLYFLKKLMDRSPKLILVGETTSKKYEEFVKSKVRKYNLQEDVVFTGKVTNEDLYAYYRASDVFLCLSEHEGFGVPIVESFAFDLPVIAYDSPESNIRYTLNGGGILLKEKDPRKIAALISILSKNRALRREVIKTQREAIKSYENSYVISKFFRFLEWLGLKLNREKKEKILESQKLIKKPKVQIEGPFDSSYSLALVNREMAKALDNHFPNKVALYSTEGYGDFEPNEEFLNENPDVKRMWELGEKGVVADVVARNLYPPRVYDMKGLINIMNSYGWEESEFPKEYLKDFNRFLDALPVMSPYVKKIMIDNGISIPVFEVGIGVDHVLNVEPKEFPLKTKKKFKFLHISSGFPRKGLDVLLEAYTSAFTSKDDVVLIIKTFPNPHNNVEDLVGKYKSKPNCPEIELINEDLPYEYIVGLYRKSDCLVQPTRGEGFGLPMAEAMLLGIPVITTAYGGQSYFCNDENSWLIDFKFTKAKTHMNLFNSYWVEPSKEHLADLMQYIYKNRESKEVEEKIKKAKETLLRKFKWSDCSQRLINVISEVENLPVFLNKKVNVAWISTWNTRCGIASYSKFILDRFSDDLKVKIISNKVPSEEIINMKEENNVTRVWNLGAKQEIYDILTEIDKEDIDTVFIQYNFGLIDVNYLGKLIEELKLRNKNVFVTLHSVKDVNKPDFKASLKWIVKELSKVDRIFVHSLHDLNYLKDIGLIQNVALFPHGVELRNLSEKRIDFFKKELGLEGKKIIASFGFLLPHKGIVELIEAFNLVKEHFRNLHLLLLNSLYPVPESKEYLEICRETIKRLGLEKEVTLITDFLPEDDVRHILATADVVVYPYQHTQESSSSAVRYSLSLKKPVICTPLEIFDDVSDVVFFTKDTSYRSIAERINSLLSKPEEVERKVKSIERWLECVSWDSLAERLENIIKYFKVYD